MSRLIRFITRVIRLRQIGPALWLDRIENNKPWYKK